MHIARVIVFALVLAAAPAAAQDRPMVAPPGQGASGPSEQRDRTPDEPRAARDPAPERDEGLERARAAARAADPSGGRDCLSAREARGAIAAKRAVSLAQALRTARGAWDGDVIDYKLCTFNGALAYELTLLNDGGRVARVRIEAASGKLMGVR
ncbi:MAG: hypothetical protein DI565_06115 [Ancylobacter novellus]|uniref:PepSY domain-containing protein n=1 Tax=Ancylobacter novellus TaxID=921 RepID=A0A2W5KJ63_ANCNO|nr:MAG: hypothetical protein DI565_06115 [Ancylobacter novellus]